MHTQHAAALGAALESCGKAPRMHAHGFKPRSAVDSRIGRSLMWQVHVRCWAGSGVCWVIEKAQRRPPVCMGSICGRGGRVPNRSDACMRSTCRGGSEDHVCWGSVGLAAGWGGSRRAARAPRPRVRSGNKIILYASALRGPSRARPRRALHCVCGAGSRSRDPAAFIIFAVVRARGDRRGVVVTFYE